MHVQHCGEETQSSSQHCTCVTAASMGAPLQAMIFFSLQIGGGLVGSRLLREIGVEWGSELTTTTTNSNLYKIVETMAMTCEECRSEGKNNSTP